MKHSILLLIRIYQYTLSPLLGAHCRYMPSCSAYMSEAVKKHGAWKGAMLGCKRILRCHPWGGYGVDPVPGEPVPDKDDGDKESS